jgi:hypothetical protein
MFITELNLYDWLRERQVTLQHPLIMKEFPDKADQIRMFVANAGFGVPTLQRTLYRLEMTD